MTKKNIKYQTILDDLLSAIRNGTYQPDDQLPAERELALQYGVARTTARRALTDLSDMGLTVRRGRKGTIVSPGTNGSHVETLNLICTAEPLAAVSDFLYSGVLTASAQGWGLKLTRVAPNDELTLLRALSLGSRHMVFGALFEKGLGDKVTKAIAAAADRSVVIGTRLDQVNVTSITADDKKGMSIAINMLLELGHRNIALAIGGEPSDNPILSPMVSEWKKLLNPYMSLKELKSSQIRTLHLPFQDISMQAYRVFRTFLASPKAAKVTAVICLYEEIATGVAAACRDHGLSIPEDISLVEYGITHRARLATPPRTGISVQVDQHVALATKLLKNNQTGKDKLLHHIKPQLVEGKTIGPAPKKK